MNPLKVWQEWREEVGRIVACAPVWQPMQVTLLPPVESWLTSGS